MSLGWFGRRAVIIPAAIVFGLFALYGFWWEPSSFRLVYHPVTLTPAMSVSRAPLRIAVLSDVHGGAPYIDEAKLDAIVARTNAAKPDLILLTGDYVSTDVIGGWHMPIETIAAHLKALRAPLGVFAVLGNHDRWEGAPAVSHAFSKAAIPDLEDRNVRLSRDGETLYLVGLSDFNTGERNIGAALMGLPYSARAICFTHSPDIFPALPGTCALTIAGHTHGGQVWLPFLGRLIVPSRFGERYASGLIREGYKVLFVSTGIGTSMLPVRFGVPPEVSILEINTRP